jgi:hypothetical protein
MMTIWAVVRDGKIVPLDSVPLPDGTRLLVTVLSDEDDRGFWQAVDQDALTAIWDNAQDDVYGQLLKE